MAKLTPYLVGSEYLDAWDETEATIKNNTVTTAEDRAVPADMTVCILSSDADIWYNLTDTAALPTNDSGTASFLAGGIEKHLNVGQVTNISLISATGTAHVCSKFWG